jgi:hypothetical protein
LKERGATRKVGVVLLGSGVSLLAFILYVNTLAPTVLYLDSPLLLDAAMLQMQVCVLGITHPTGYPTYLMLSHLFTYLPFGDCAYRANLASAAYAALAVSAVYAAGLLLTGRSVAAAVGALAFGLGTIFWSQAVIAEVYTINALFVALSLVALLLWRNRRRDGYLVLSALCIGLAMTNHLTSGLLLLASFLFVAMVDWRKLVDAKLVLKGIGAFLLGLTPYLYLPIRSSLGAPMVANNPNNLERFLYVVSGGDLRGGFFAFGPAELPGRIAFYGQHLLENFNWVLLAVGMAGFAAMLLWDRAVAVFTGFLFVGWGFHAIENDIVDVQLYFIPTYVVLSLWICFGLGVLLQETEAIVARASSITGAVGLGALSLVLLLLPLAGVGKAYAANDRSGDYRGREITGVVAENAAPGATILHLRSSLWYMVLVEERRQDLTLVDPFQGYKSGRYNDVVWPDDVDDTQTMYRRYGTDDKTGVTAAEKAAERGPVYVLAHENISGQPFHEAGFRTMRVEGPLYELVPPGGEPATRG